MSEQSKKQSFLGGAAILAGAVAVVKVIGALYKLPLNNILGDVGKTYFQTAYEIYNVLLTVSTAGLGFARQVGKELFLAADSFHVGSVRGSGESAGVGLTRPWSGAVSCRSGAAVMTPRS